MKLKYFALPIVLLLGACAASDIPMSNNSFNAKIEHQGDSSYVKVVGLAVKNSDSFIALQVEVANADFKPRQIYYRVKWLDESGFQVWDDEPWKSVLIQGSARQNLTVTSPTPKARDFRIQFNAENNRPNDPTEPGQ